MSTWDDQIDIVAGRLTGGETPRLRARVLDRIEAGPQRSQGRAWTAVAGIACVAAVVVVSIWLASRPPQRPMPAATASIDLSAVPAAMPRATEPAALHPEAVVDPNSVATVQSPSAMLPVTRATPAPLPEGMTSIVPPPIEVEPLSRTSIDTAVPLTFEPIPFALLEVQAFDEAATAHD